MQADHWILWIQHIKSNLRESQEENYKQRLLCYPRRHMTLCCPVFHSLIGCLHYRRYSRVIWSSWLCVKRLLIVCECMYICSSWCTPISESADSKRVETMKEQDSCTSLLQNQRSNPTIELTFWPHQAFIRERQPALESTVGLRLALHQVCESLS